jgi:transcriptional regulator with XRE-family HTH domain
MASQYKQRVGKNINRYRNASGKTLREVADEIGLTEGTFQKYEAGNISRVDVEMLQKIATAINCTIEDLISWDEGEHEAYNAEVKAKRLANHNKLFSQLTLENQKLINEQIRFLLHQQKSHNTHKESDK